MTVDRNSFRTAFPEFDNAPDALIDEHLARALLITPASTWGTQQDSGVKLRTARSLALSPQGRGMELNPDGKTVYDFELDELMTIVAGGGRVL